MHFAVSWSSLLGVRIGKRVNMIRQSWAEVEVIPMFVTLVRFDLMSRTSPGHRYRFDLTLSSQWKLQSIPTLE